MLSPLPSFSVILVAAVVVALPLTPGQREATRLAAQLPGQPSSTAWPQWGGPNRNFVANTTGLASTWPVQGPTKLWSRALGEGHAAITSDGARLYTLYRPLIPGSHAEEEAVAAFDVTTGKVAWEHRFASSTVGVHFGPYVGPHSTPLVTADRLYAAGSRKQLFALDKSNGKVVWSHDLIKEYGAPEGDRGYACSPLLFNDLVITSVGGSGQALAAFNARTGALVWKAGDFQQSPGSPILIEVDGQMQVVYLAGDAVAGFDPATGRTLWAYPHRTTASLNITTPLWLPSEKLLFISSAYGHGSRLLALRQSGGKTTVSERWFNNRVRIHFSNAVRVGNQVVASSGDFGPVFLSGVDVQSGTIAWQDRSFSRAQVLSADGKLLILDEDGHLGLASVSPAGLQILAKARILETIAWTPPTLLGTKLFVRDRKTIAAYELGK
jgi:outer membrane protein assembly factor BamB